MDMTGIGRVLFVGGLKRNLKYSCAFTGFYNILADLDTITQSFHDRVNTRVGL
jgi:hypothetical protein